MLMKWRENFADEDKWDEELRKECIKASIYIILLSRGISLGAEKINQSNDISITAYDKI